MKKIISLLAITILFAGALQAQFVTKGTKMVSTQVTNLGFNSISFKMGSSDESTKMNRIGLSFAGGYAIMDDLMILGSVAFQSFKFDESKLNALTIGAMGRKYFNSGLFAGAGVGLVTGKVGKDSETTSTTMIDGSLQAGYSFEILPKLILEPIVAFSTKLAGGKIEDFDHKLKYTQFSISVGFTYLF